VELPLLKQLYERYAKQDFVLISVSIDEDLAAMRGMITRRGMTWPQIGDGKGPETELAGLYNAGAGTHYIIDRQGRIAGLHQGAHGVPRMARLIEQLLAAPPSRHP
jgi:alkyl hydroperoxide reductase subunit AhpC